MGRHEARGDTATRTGETADMDTDTPTEDRPRPRVETPDTAMTITRSTPDTAMGMEIGAWRNRSRGWKMWTGEVFKTSFKL